MPPAGQGRGKEAAAFLQVGMLRRNRWLNQAVRKKTDGRRGGGEILENGSLAILRLEELARCSALKA